MQGLLEALVGSAGEALLHDVLVEHLAAVDLHNICCHKSYSLLELKYFSWSRIFTRKEAGSPAKYRVKRNDAASQEVTHSVVAVYAMIIAERGEKRNRQI